MKHSLRSIVFQNFSYLYENQMGLGTPVCKTSTAFIKGYLAEKNDFIYL